MPVSPESKKPAHQFPFDSTIFLEKMPISCIYLKDDQGNVSGNECGRRLLDENPTLSSQLLSQGDGMLGVLGEKRLYIDLTLCGELKRYVFEKSSIQKDFQVWMGWNSEQSSFLRGMEMTELIGRKLAHELKNPLQPIQILIEQWMEMVPRFEEDGKIVLSQIEKMREVLSQFRSFSDSTPLKMEALNINRYLEEQIHQVQKTSPDNIKWTYLPLGEVPEILADPSRLAQVFLNIFRNVVEALSPDGGLVQTAITLDKGKKSILVEISDSGSGIPPDVMARVFSPFFTTKVKGTGLGLVVSRQIVNMHGGEMSLFSQEDIGTTVTVLLPINRKSGGR